MRVDLTRITPCQRAARRFGASLGLGAMAAGLLGAPKWKSKRLALSRWDLALKPATMRCVEWRVGLRAAHDHTHASSTPRRSWELPLLTRRYHRPRTRACPLSPPSFCHRSYAALDAWVSSALFLFLMAQLHRESEDGAPALTSPVNSQTVAPAKAATSPFLSAAAVAGVVRDLECCAGAGGLRRLSRPGGDAAGLDFRPIPPPAAGGDGPAAVCGECASEFRTFQAYIQHLQRTCHERSPSEA